MIDRNKISIIIIMITLIKVLIRYVNFNHYYINQENFKNDHFNQ